MLPNKTNEYGILLMNATFFVEVQSVGWLVFKCNNKKASNAWFIITLRRYRRVLSDFFLALILCR